MTGTNRDTFVALYLYLYAFAQNSTLYLNHVTDVHILFPTTVGFLSLSYVLHCIMVLNAYEIKNYIDFEL